MSYNLSTFDDASNSFGKYDAEIEAAGMAHGDYGEQLIFVCNPANDKMRMQILFMSVGKGDFKLGGKSEIISIGEGANAFTAEIYPEIIDGPPIKTISNAGLFLNMLKHLGFEVETGVITEYVGLKLTLEEVAINEALKRFNTSHPDAKDIPARTGDYADKTITLPVAILAHPKKRTTLKAALLQNAEGMTEDEISVWYKQSEYYIEGKTAPLYETLDVLVASGEIIKDKETKRYTVKTR